VQMAHFNSSNWKLNWNFYDRHQEAEAEAQLNTIAWPKGRMCIVCAHLTDSNSLTTTTTHNAAADACEHL